MQAGQVRARARARARARVFRVGVFRVRVTIDLINRMQADQVHECRWYSGGS